MHAIGAPPLAFRAAEALASTGVHAVMASAASRGAISSFFCNCSARRASVRLVVRVEELIILPAYLLFPANDVPDELRERVEPKAGPLTPVEVVA